MITITLSKSVAEELLYKLDILANEPDLLEEYGLPQQDAVRLVDSIPHSGGSWQIPLHMIPAVAGETQDAADIISDLARDAKNDLDLNEARRLRKLARALETLAVKLQSNL